MQLGDSRAEAVTADIVVVNKVVEGVMYATEVDLMLCKNTRTVLLQLSGCGLRHRLLNDGLDRIRADLAIARHADDLVWNDMELLQS